MGTDIGSAAEVHPTCAGMLISRSRVLHDPWGVGLILSCQGGTNS